MPETEILALPNANVADAVGRLPGVTVQRDEGEAVYVQVRGLDPRLTNTTIDGVTIPSPESNVRQVLLATIPADMVQSVELNKTLSANQDADGIGGSVNMVTKMAGEEPTIDGISTLGYSPIMNGRYMGLVDFTVGKRFGATKRWGVIASASYDYNGRGYNDIEPQPDLNPDGSDDSYYDDHRSARISPTAPALGRHHGRRLQAERSLKPGRSLHTHRLQGLGRQVDLHGHRPMASRNSSTRSGVRTLPSAACRSAATISSTTSGSRGVPLSRAAANSMPAAIREAPSTPAQR